MPKVEVFPSFKKLFAERQFDRFDRVMAFADGEKMKGNRHRSVVKFHLDSNGAGADFYLKRHLWPELKDKVRDLLALRFPLSDGQQELENIRAVAALKIPTMNPAAWGERRRGFLRRQSFLITESLGELERLENYLTRRFARPLSPAERLEKRRLLAAVAAMVRRLHGAGLFHHDLYCGHILVKENPAADPTLYLIDLQRVRPHFLRRRRWQAKDLSALDYTADPRAISRADRLRFFLQYLGMPLKPSPLLTPSLKRWIYQILRRTRRTARHTEKKRARYLQIPK